MHENSHAQTYSSVARAVAVWAALFYVAFQKFIKCKMLHFETNAPILPSTGVQKPQQNQQEC